MSALPLTPKQSQRFWSRVLIDEWSPDACWEWQGSVGSTGYGTAKCGSSSTSVHRIAYMAAIGSIQRGLVVRHKCDNKLCCRPDHLEVGTHKQNRGDSIERGNWKPKMCSRRVAPETVVDIRWRRHVGQPPAQVAEECGCTVQTVQRITAGVSYPHLPGPVTAQERSA